MSESRADFRENLGKCIGNLRTERNYGVREFALLANIEHHQLINIEKGRVDIRISTLIKIARGLKVELKDLLDFEI